MPDEAAPRSADASVEVRDRHGKTHLIPVAPSAADRLAMDRQNAAQDARRPFSELLAELEAAAADLLALSPSDRE